jgi:5,10-methylenetetrahydromethanopterin reductase
MIEVAREVERLGFDSLWVPDERFYRDVYGISATLATATERVALGPCVTDPYSRHPALTATAIATLDELSGGRAVLGIGAGTSGFRELGITRQHPATAVHEAVSLIRLLLTGRQTTFDGSTVHFDGQLDFAPVRASIPILIAAQGPRLLQVAGAVGDGVILQAQVTHTELSRSIALVKSGAARARRHGTPFALIARVDVAVASDIDMAYAALRPRVARILTREWPTFDRFQALGLDVPPELAALSAGIDYTHDPQVLAPIAARVPKHFVDAFCIATTPSTLGERLRIFREHSIDELIVNPVPIRGDEIEPVVAAVAGARSPV